MFPEEISHPHPAVVKIVLESHQNGVAKCKMECAGDALSGKANVTCVEIQQPNDIEFRT